MATPIKDLVRHRRNCKGNMTRAVNMLKAALENAEVNMDTVSDLFSRVSTTFEAVEAAHDVVIGVIDDDAAYEKEEEWMADVQSTFLEMRLLKESFMRQKRVEDSTDEPADPKAPSKTPGGDEEKPSSETANDGKSDKKDEVQINRDEYITDSFIQQLESDGPSPGTNINNLSIGSLLNMSSFPGDQDVDASTPSVTPPKATATTTTPAANSGASNN